MADPTSTGVREVLIGTVVVTALLSIGTVGYMLLEGWTPLDALYMTFITITTIGFEEVHELSDAGHVFTMVVATLGIGTFATLASRAVQILVLSSRLRARRMQRRIDSLSGHYVLCGFGRIGQRVAKDLRDAGRDVVVIERRDDRAEELAERGYLYVQDNAEEEDTLRAAGLERARGLVLVLPQDAANVFVSLTAREIRPETGAEHLFIIAHTNEPSSYNKLLRAGVDKVISPLEIGADRIAQTILRPQVRHFVDRVLGVGPEGYDLEEIPVTTGSRLEGRSLADVDFRSRFHAIVIGVLKASGAWQFNPDATVPLESGDTLIVLGAPEGIQEVASAGQAT